MVTALVGGEDRAAQAAQCLQHAFGGPTMCAGNGARLTNVNVGPVSDACQFDGDTFTFTGTLAVRLDDGGIEDVGIYIGGEPLTSQQSDCTVFTLPTTSPYFDLDSDTCGDMLGDDVSHPFTVTNLTVPCLDQDDDGFFDFPYCTSYSTTNADDCNGTSDAVPSSSTNCRCGNVQTNLAVPDCSDDPSLCNDGNPCTDDLCHFLPSGGDIFGCDYIDNTEPCSDGVFCNGAETCSSGSCVSPGDPCLGGGVCGNSCNEAADNCFRPAGTICRGALGVCDVQETCTGSSSACPSDTLRGTGTICRAAAGSCDFPENCTGLSPTCGADSFAPPIVCRAAAGICDVAEQCSGTSATCPANAFRTTNTACRAAAGTCDVVENCSGSSAVCPADTVRSTSTVCRAAAGICDVAENCSGTSVTCPANAFAASSAACRASAGVCDLAEACSGSSAACPANTFAATSIVCRAASGICDLAESCSGSAAACPSNVFASTAIACRAAAGVCDAAESCSGTSSSCPADAFAVSSTACRASSGICDIAEACSGSSAACPANAFAATSTVCRAASGICDLAESCSGSSAACPSNQFASTSTTCRAAAGVCDAAESCNGSSASCPTDAFAVSSTTCRASAGICDLAEACSGSSAPCPANVFASTASTCRAAGGVCDVAETCPGTTSTCPADTLASTATTCRGSAGVCDVAETCSGSSTSCPVNSLASTNTVCRAASADCDATERCSGSAASCPADVFDPPGTACGDAGESTCDHADTCDQSGTCLANFAVDGSECDDANICTREECVQGSCQAADVAACPLVPAERAAGDQFGAATALTPDYLVVGAPASLNASSGRVHIFERSGDVFVEQFQTAPIPVPLRDADHPTGDLDFGSAVDADGDTIVVGAPNDVVDTGDALSSGSVSVFVRSGEAWTFQARLLDESGSCAPLGADVAISGDTIVLGGADGDCALVFERSGSTWSLAKRLEPEVGGVRFGIAVDVSGDWVLVGAPGGESGSDCAGEGTVYAYRRGEGDWDLQDTIAEPEQTGGGSCFGVAVGVDAATAVVGAPGDDTAAAGAGAAWVLERVGDDWNIVEQLLPPDGFDIEGFGSSLDLRDDFILVGAPGFAAFLFQRVPDVEASLRAATSLLQRSYTPPPDAPPENSNFATAVGMGSGAATIGADGEDAPGLVDAGAVYPDTLAPVSSIVCGDSLKSSSEDCDDGDTEWVTGEYCNAECEALACGDSNDSGSVTAGDALFTLRAAVGAVQCDLRVCDVNSSGSTTAPDALLLLRKSVGAAVTLDCP